ncbi:hypothetical protein AWB76_05189 [Caballeronia temeraria]|uniref:Uncharacterized protein n=1 Tax=Caballeronia temeraria TaxID=1777137 RepID=A0A158C814_9BURK|nr:hypothetical protein [Caballeronia temeraria]SAK78056.1 hypothetical protein AWB76_05189 [Caballeronia temeraria]
MNRREEFYAARERVFKGKHQHYFIDVLQAPSSATADVIEWESIEGIGHETRCKIRFTHTSHDLSQREYLGQLGSLLIQENLMGGGAWKESAVVGPNYLECVRKHFSILTAKTWKIGYEAS